MMTLTTGTTVTWTHPDMGWIVTGVVTGMTPEGNVKFDVTKPHKTIHYAVPAVSLTVVA